MQGLMQDRPLLISSLIDHANAMHPRAAIVSRTVEGPVHRCTYGDIHRRSKQVANALQALGVRPGDRVATLAWNGYRHMELYFGVSGMGAVLHTIDPRLFPEQIAYIANHAEDLYLFFDLTFAPLIEKLGPRMASVKGFVAMTDREHMPALGVSTVWLMLFQYVDTSGADPKEDLALKRVVIGGSACDERKVRDHVRCVRRPRLGDDGDVAARHRVQPAAEAPGPRFAATARRAGETGARHVRRRDEGQRRCGSPAAARRDGIRPPDGARAVDHERLFQERRRR